MALVKVQVSGIKVDKQIPYDLVGSNNALIVPKGTVMTNTIVDKLFDQDIFVDYQLPPDRDSEDEDIGIVSNKLSKLSLGQEVHSFNIIIREDAVRFKLIPCQYIGWVKNLSLVIEMPRYGNDAHSKLFQLEPGQKIQAKMQCGKTEYIFQSFVMCVTNNPLPHVHIKHPNQVKALTFRKAIRKEVNIKATLNLFNESHHITLVDLSDRGCGFISEITLSTLDPISVKISINYIDTHNEELTLDFELKNTNKFTGMFRYGGDFINVGIKDRIKLRSFLYGI